MWILKTNARIGSFYVYLKMSIKIMILEVSMG